MDSMSMSMSMSMTSTASAAAATSSMAGMDMSSMSSGSCKTAMLWNWYTIDACFLAESWHITSRGMFAGSCIGVILLVMMLEFLRRVTKDYDRLLLRQHQRAMFAQYSSTPRAPAPAPAPAPKAEATCCDGGSSDSDNEITPKKEAAVAATATNAARGPGSTVRRTTRFRPNILQQAIRALLHMLQFACAYFVMLLAMYYNGYLIICIFIGAFLGAFVFSWESVEVGFETPEDSTLCCG